LTISNGFFWALEYILIAVAIAIVVLFGSIGIHGFCLKLGSFCFEVGFDDYSI
jgi:hypothetical protein